jgi:hypothetical protein
MDIGRSLGLLFFVGALSAFYGMVGQLFIGRFHLDLSAPLGIVFGIASWHHASWLRILILAVGWLAVAVLGVLLVALPFIGSANLTLTLGSIAIKNPLFWQVYAVALLVAPLLWLVLAVLHSEKAKAEFQKPNSEGHVTLGHHTPR